MPVRIYVLATWTTFSRLPLITDDVAGFSDGLFLQRLANTVRKWWRWASSVITYTLFSNCLRDSTCHV